MPLMFTFKIRKILFFLSFKLNLTKPLFLDLSSELSSLFLLFQLQLLRVLNYEKVESIVCQFLEKWKKNSFILLQCFCFLLLFPYRPFSPSPSFMLLVTKEQPNTQFIGYIDMPVVYDNKCVLG